MDRLANITRPYSWGSRTALATLLGLEPTGEPQAELWMGAHPGAPSTVDRGEGPRPLNAVIDADPARELGPDLVRRFGPVLPFLLKLLAAGEPLSLQVHPDPAQARAGFAAEEAAGLPLADERRVYKDANHKPELICALDEFTGLCGFRDPRETARLLADLDVPALTPLIEVLRGKPESEALRGALTLILTDPDYAAAVPATTEALDRADPALRPYAAIGHSFPGDAGVIAALLLNLFRLQPGEALFLAAGVPHAYLSGLGVELLANSDNVVRCGLTPKHVDVPELLRIVVFRSAVPDVLHPVPVPESDGEEVYPTPVDDFRLSRYVLGGTAPTTRQLPGSSPQILLCVEGAVALTDADGSSFTLHRGESAFVPADSVGPVAGNAAGDHPSTLFRATASTTTPGN